MRVTRIHPSCIQDLSCCCCPGQVPGDVSGPVGCVSELFASGTLDLSIMCSPNLLGASELPAAPPPPLRAHIRLIHLLGCQRNPCPTRLNDSLLKHVLG